MSTKIKHFAPSFKCKTMKFGILIAKRLFNGKSLSSNLAFMPVTNKVGQKVKKIVLRLISI